MSIYFAGMYITLLLLVVMNEYRSFRDYYEERVQFIIDILGIKIDAYSFMLPNSFIISLFSWAGVIYTLFMIVDCYVHQK